jgi:hypothetical protein
LNDLIEKTLNNLKIEFTKKQKRTKKSEYQIEKYNLVIEYDYDINPKTNKMNIPLSVSNISLNNIHIARKIENEINNLT